MSGNIAETLGNLVHQTAFFNLTWGNYLMIAVACVFLYLAIKKGYEPLLLVPIAFGMLLVNIYPDIMISPENASNGVGGLHYFFKLDEWSILPSLIFLGVGALTDFRPLIANPISFLLGAVIGIERQFRRREAGMRTFTLICMGSTAAMLVSIWIPQCYPNFLNGDPGRIAAQVLSGIGFLGAGAIIQSHGSVHGLTTAACIWVMAVIGLAVGAGMYIPAAIATVITLFILVSLERLEKRMFLNGVNKILAITCSTATPDLKAVRKILESKGVFIVSVSFETFYKEDRSVITYKVNVKAISSYTNLFNEIRSLGIVTQIRLMA